MIRHRYEAWNAALIPSSAQARAKRAAAAAAEKRRRDHEAMRRRAATPVGPPRPPNAAAYPFPVFEDRSEAEWEKLLNARVKPYKDAVTNVNEQQLGQSEFKFEQAEAANKRLGEGFAKLFTGGKEGAEGEAYAKENFGGHTMGMQAVAIAHQHLTQLTSDWNERDWAISTEYQKAMAEIPGLKEQMRESIYRQDTDEYTRNFNYVNLMLDEAWNIYDANSKAYDAAEQRRIAEAAIRREQGLTGYDTRKEAVAEATKYTDDTGFIWKVRKTKNGWEAYQTKQPKAKPAGSQTTEIQWKNAALREASDMTKATGNIWKAQKVDGQWTAVDTGKPKVVAPGKGNKGLSNAQVAENKLLDEIYSNKLDYIGKKVENPAWKNARNKTGIPQFINEGGMTFADAYAELLDRASIALSAFRSAAYIDRWVRQRLDNLYPGSKASAAKPRGG